jgi:DUF4097 and DUF4098 domain-containing protein YvlB
MQRTFTTPDPVSLYVELRAGDLVVETGDTAETVVDVNGRNDDTDDVVVDQRGEEILVVAKQGRGGFFASSSHKLDVRVRVPHDSRLTTKLGSADVRVEGRLGDTMLKSGSGDVRIDRLGAEAYIETGSGDVLVDASDGALRVKCGSGDVTIDRLGGPAEISTGSGDVVVNAAHGPVTVKSGSGDMRVRDAAEDVSLSTASGDLVVDRIRRGQLTAKNVSGDIKVGVPAGIPVWTDVTSMTGGVRSTLEGAGEPAEGQDFIEVRAKTVSGDVLLEQL